MSENAHDQQDDEPHAQCLEGYETTEVAHYIHDMLGSLEAIASKCDMDAVAALLAQAQAETSKHY